MINLEEYFSYNKDYDNIPLIYDDLSKQLKNIHNSGMIVSDLSSKSIIYDEQIHYSNIEKPYHFDVQKRENILSFCKLLLGTYLSYETNFKDFSKVDNEWFINNLEEILDVLGRDSLDSDYFKEVLLNGENTYYCDFLDRKKQADALNNRSNVNGLRKVLKTAASSLYEDDEYQEDVENQKVASIKFLFFPLLIGGSLLITLLIFVLIEISH